MNKNLAAIAKQKRIKYFLISFVDLFGVLRAKLVHRRLESSLAHLMVGEIFLGIVHHGRLFRTHGQLFFVSDGVHQRVVDPFAAGGRGMGGSGHVFQLLLASYLHDGRRHGRHQ